MGFTQDSATWFKAGDTGAAKLRKRQGIVNRLDVLSRQAYNIASDRALSLDGRERFIRTLILHTNDLTEDL
jgi:hypothetical protein